MNLTYEEQERQAYLKGNTYQADLLDKLIEYEPDGYDIDMCLDELNLYGARGKVLYDACCDLAQVKSNSNELRELLLEQIKQSSWYSNCKGNLYPSIEEYTDLQLFKLYEDVVKGNHFE